MSSPLLACFFRMVKITSCLRERARLSRPISCAISSNSGTEDRKSTRLNSSHVRISYAVFCLKKKSKNRTRKSREGTVRNLPVHQLALSLARLLRCSQSRRHWLNVKLEHHLLRTSGLDVVSSE